MNYYGMNKLIEDSMLYEKIVSKVKKSLVNDLKYGYYVTCISDVKGKHLVEKQYEKAVSKGTRWLVSPVEHIKDIDYTVRNTHEYRLFFVRKKITPSQIVGELHLTEGSIVVSGAVLKKCFVAGFLSKRDLLSSKNSVRVSKNNTGIRPHKYYAYEDYLQELFIVIASDLSTWDPTLGALTTHFRPRFVKACISCKNTTNSTFSSPHYELVHADIKRAREALSQEGIRNPSPLEIGTN